MIFSVSRVLKRTPRTGLSREGPRAERYRRNPAACSHRIHHFAASWRLLHQGWLAIGKYWAEIQQLALMTKFCLPSCHTMARARHEQRCLSLWIERVVPRCLSFGDGLSVHLLGKRWAVIQQLDRTRRAMLTLLPDSQVGHALTRQDWVNKRISWRTPLRVCQGSSACS